MKPAGNDAPAVLMEWDALGLEPFGLLARSRAVGQVSQLDLRQELRFDLIHSFFVICVGRCAQQDGQQQTTRGLSSE